MPAEVRIIAFTPEEVLEAIDGFSAIADKRLFTGKAIDCHVRKDPEVHAVLQVQRADGEKIGTVDLNSAQLAAALISFCCGHRIPLPRVASKELDVIDGQLVLRLELGVTGRAVLRNQGLPRRSNRPLHRKRSTAQEVWAGPPTSR